MTTPSLKPTRTEDVLGTLYSKLDKLNAQLSHTYVCLGHEIYADRDIATPCERILVIARQILAIKNEIMQREYDEAMDR